MALQPSDLRTRRRILLAISIPTAWFSALFIPTSYLALGWASTPDLVSAEGLEPLTCWLDAHLPGLLLQPDSSPMAYYTRLFLLISSTSCLLIHTVCIDTLTRPYPFTHGSRKSHSMVTRVGMVFLLSSFVGQLMSGDMDTVDWIVMLGPVSLVLGLTVGLALWAMGWLGKDRWDEHVVETVPAVVDEKRGLILLEA